MRCYSSIAYRKVEVESLSRQGDRALARWGCNPPMASTLLRVLCVGVMESMRCYPVGECEKWGAKATSNRVDQPGPRTDWLDEP
jgi:hypothetical protein